MTRRGLRVVIDARVQEEAGGVQQVVQGLAFGFSQLDYDADLIFLTREHRPSWLMPFLGVRHRTVTSPSTLGVSRKRRVYDRAKGVWPASAAVLDRLLPVLAQVTDPVARSDGFLESLKPDVVHFTTQQAFLTAVPSIYQPHDLQHLHLPELFSPAQRRRRMLTYRAFAEQADIVAVMTEWGRQDLVTALRIPESQVAVVPWAPVAGLRRAAASRPLPPNLPRSYLLFPAQTWPHKNHLRLMRALWLLRRQGLRLNLVSIGRMNDHFPRIRSLVDELGIGDQVHFLGHVDDDMVDVLYRNATAVIYPSLFEGWGLPVVEAFAYGIPVAASSATVLPEVTAGAALLFDPESEEAISHALARIMKDDDLRKALKGRGLERAKELSWTRTASTFLALYRKIAGRKLDDTDRGLLGPPTLIDGT